jgi:hypothetical protein
LRANRPHHFTFRREKSLKTKILQTFAEFESRFSVVGQGSFGCHFEDGFLHCQWSFIVYNGFVAQIRWLDSLYEASVVAGENEQLGTTDLQDQELVGMQPSPEAARFTIDLVWRENGVWWDAIWQEGTSAGLQWCSDKSLPDDQGAIWFALAADDWVRRKLAGIGRAERDSAERDSAELQHFLSTTKNVAGRDPIPGGRSIAKSQRSKSGSHS